MRFFFQPLAAEIGEIQAGEQRFAAFAAHFDAEQAAQAVQRPSNAASRLLTQGENLRLMRSISRAERVSR